MSGPEGADTRNGVHTRTAAHAVVEAACCVAVGVATGAVLFLVAPLLQPLLGAALFRLFGAVLVAVTVGAAVAYVLRRSHRALSVAERRLDEHRALYEDFFVNASDVFYTADSKGVFHLVNPAGERLTGYSVERDRPNLFEIVSPEYLPLVREMAARKSNGASRTAYQLEITTKDGERVPVEVSTRLIYDEEGREAGVQGVLRDISERRAAERQLRENEALLSLLIDSIPEGVVLLDEDFRIVRCNPAASELLTECGDTLDGRLVRIADQPTDGLLDLTPGSPDGVFEVNGPERRVIQVYGRRLAGGPLPGGVLVLRDTTMERRVADQVQQHARLAAVGELAAGVAHDFNNLLQGIAAIAEAVRGEVSLSEQAQSDIATIIDQTGLGSRVTRQLLDFSRRSPLTRQIIDLGDLLREVCPLLQRTLPSKIAFTLDVPDDRVPVLADTALI